jgi:hypothetical protein
LLIIQYFATAFSSKLWEVIFYQILNAPEPSEIKRFGFMSGKIQIPDDFDRMGEQDILNIFEDDA